MSLSMKDLFPENLPVSKSLLRQNLIMTYGNMSDLKQAATPEANNAVVFLNGYYTTGDGGGGFFVWSSNSNSSDNGGTVIQPQALTGAGRWLRIIDSAHNIRWFGAKGDGVTDDTQSIQKAINSSDDIFIPDGTFLITSPVTIKTNSKIQGSTREKAILKKSNFSGAAIYGEDIQSVTLEDFTLLGPGQWVGSGNKGILIKVTNNSIVPNLNFARLIISEFNDIGMYIGTGAFCSYDNLCFRKNGYCSLFIDGGDAHSLNAVTVRDCILGILLNGDGGAHCPTTTVLNSCYVEEAGCGFSLQNALNCQLTACGVEAPIYRDASFPGTSYLITGGDCISLESCLSRHDTSGTTISSSHLTVNGSAKNVFIKNFRKVNHGSRLAAQPEADIALANGSVVFVGHNFDTANVSKSANWAVPSYTVS